MAYFKIPLDEPCLKGLSANEVIVLFWLINWCQLSDHNGICNLKAQDISDRISCNISVPTLRRVITKLVSLGYISVSYTTGCNWCISIANSDQNDQPRVIKMIKGSDQNDQPRVIKMIKGSDQNDQSHYIKKVKERIKESKKAPSSDSSDLITPSPEVIKAVQEAMKRHGL